MQVVFSLPAAKAYLSTTFVFSSVKSQFKNLFRQTTATLTLRFCNLFRFSTAGKHCLQGRRQMSDVKELPPTPTNVPLEIKDWRKAYLNMKEPFLKQEAMLDDPFLQFDLWFKDISAHKDLSFEEVNAVCLSTCRDNRPSSRMVLMKKYEPAGYSFYSNDTSRKGQDIASNPNGAMLFYWPAVSRQIRIEGTIEKLPLSDADDYWSSRPLHSRIGSKASNQGAVVESRHVLEDEKTRLEKLAATDGEAAITRPKSWIGFILKPTNYEFWQGQSNRLHDRIVYNLVKGSWQKQRLAP